MFICRNSYSFTALELANLKWPCYECDKKFRTSAQLQKHLAVHDDTMHENPEDSEEVFDTSGDNIQKPNGRQKRRRGRSPKKSRVNFKAPSIKFFRLVFESFYETYLVSTATC